MPSKTPNFDKALDEILKKLVPHERVCGQCKQPFKVEKEDIDFYNMLRVPPPKLCPQCRRQTRRAFVDYSTLYKRRCDAAGHDETVVSQIPEGSKFPVYDFDYYWSDKNDPLVYRRVYAASELFFKQFRELFNFAPQPATTRDPMSVNSEYTSYGVELKNCYYLFGGIRSENVSYGNWPVETKDSLDVWAVWTSERCYEIVYSKNCYHCRFVYFSNNCLDSNFLYDCRNCQNCFGGVNLRNRKYVFFNEQLTKEEYEKRLIDIDLGDRNRLEHYRRKFIELLAVSPKRNVLNQQSVNSVGTVLENCRDVYMGFFVVNGENLRYSETNWNAKDCMDILLGTAPRYCYYTVAPYDGSEIKFSVNTRNECLAIEYSVNCKNCAYCFGCIGLSNKKFCVLNKQYREEEYWPLVDGIKTEMLGRGEYGEFFPMSFSPFPYNASLAQMLVPLSDREAEEAGLWWVESVPDKFSGKILAVEGLPTNIGDVSDDILNSAIRCSKTNRLFRIVKSELEFYRRERLAVPTIHPAERIMERFYWTGLLNLSPTKCTKCGKEIMAQFPVGLKENIYCEQCYNAEVV